MCVVGSGVGSGSKTVTVSSEVQSGSLTEGWSYDVPAVSSVGVTNGATTGGVAVTIVGSGFGTAGYSAGGRVGGTGCESSTWVSDSSVVCGVASGAGSAVTVSVSSEVQSGSPVSYTHLTLPTTFGV